MPFILSGLLLGLAGPAALLQVHDAWIREAPPVASVQAGYFTACNTGEHELMLQDLHSPAFKRVEMHETIEHDGSSSMRKLDELHIAAGDCVKFARGGKHLMLFDAVERLQDGDVVELKFLVNGETFTFEFPVRRDGAPPSPHEHGH